MLGKDDVLAMILKECDICLHLHGKIPEGGMDYRPTPAQRSTLELLRFLSYCAIGGTRTAVEGTWDGFKEAEARSADMGPEDFPAHMARQKQELTDYFAGISQADLENGTMTTPLGEEVRKEIALVGFPLHWMVAYRMQLFLHAKQAGNADIWTPDCWAGIDMARPEPAASG